MGYAKNALAGFSWQTVLKLTIGLVSLVKLSILARLLTPEAFGLFSLTAIALGVTEATTQTGVNVTILQSRQSIGYFLDTAWVIAIVRGLLIGSLMIVLGLALAYFFDEPQLQVLVGIAALIPVIKGFINPSIVMLQKNLSFFNDSVYRFSLVVVDALAAIALAWVLRSVLALILAMISAALFEVLISFLFFADKPIFNYIPSRAKIIFQNSKHLSFSALFSYLNENLDNLLIRYRTTTFDLGLYDRSYALMHKINYDFAKSATHGTFPIFTKLIDQPTRLQRAFVRSSLATLAFVTVTSLPFFLFPELAIQLIFGDQWLAAIPLVRWLVIAGLLHSVTTLIYNYLISLQAYLLMNVHLALSVCLLVIFTLWLSQSYGLQGAVVGVMLARAIPLPVLGYALYQNWKRST